MCDGVCQKGVGGVNERAVAGETTPELHTTLGTEHPRNLFFYLCRGVEIEI